MSNEYNEAKPKCKLLVVLVILSLLMSIASLTMSILTYTGAGADGTGHKKVVISKQYDKGKSLEKAKDTQKPMIVFFYTDWCGFCQKFAPTFDKITKNSKIKKNFAVAYVNCENPDNRAIIEEYGVQGFPTVYVVNKEGEKILLDNNSFFQEKAKEKVSEDILKTIDKDDDKD